jgi:RNA polymerase sigma-70 factor (ECF subfamily)
MDRELLLKITQGDYQAYKELFYKYYKSLFTTLHYRTQDKDLADELAQQTFVKVWLNRKVLKPHKSFTAYINTLSTNLLKDHFRRLKIRYDYVAASPDINRSVTRNADDALAAKELQQAIHHIVNHKLAPKCRQIFILSRVGGLSNKEIAGQLLISKKTVENQLYSALKILHRYLEKDYNIYFKKL